MPIVVTWLELITKVRATAHFHYIQNYQSSYPQKEDKACRSAECHRESAGGRPTEGLILHWGTHLGRSLFTAPGSAGLLLKSERNGPGISNSFLHARVLFDLYTQISRGDFPAIVKAIRHHLSSLQCRSISIAIFL